MDAPIIYIPNFIADPDKAFEALRDELHWEHRDAPRHEYYVNDVAKPYVYGRGLGERKYEPQPYHPEILRIRRALEEYSKSVFEVCFLNYYLGPRDHLGWHSDDSPEMDDKRPIGVVSLGFEREIWFRRLPTRMSGPPMPIEKQLLGHGSLCLMLPGMQDEWQHRIPKSAVQCGERISLTYRGYVQVPT